MLDGNTDRDSQDSGRGSGYISAFPVLNLLGLKQPIAKHQVLKHLILSQSKILLYRVIQVSQ